MLLSQGWTCRQRPWSKFVIPHPPSCGKAVHAAQSTLRARRRELERQIDDVDNLLHRQQTDRQNRPRKRPAARLLFVSRGRRARPTMDANGLCDPPSSSRAPRGRRFFPDHSFKPSIDDPAGETSRQMGVGNYRVPRNIEGVRHSNTSALRSIPG